MAQLCGDPTSGYLNRDFNFSFVAGLFGTRWNNESAVMRRHLRVCSVDRRLVEAGLGDTRFQIVRNELRRDAAEECEGALMRAYPIDQTLRESGFRESVARCAEDGDEQLTVTNLAGRAVDHLKRRAGVIHE